MPSLFKTLGAVLGLVFALCLAAPIAYADSLRDGTLNFAVTSGSPAPTGSFVWDNTTSTWSSFTVDWDGVVYNYGSFFNGPIGLPLLGLEFNASWCAAAPGFLTSQCAPPATFSLDGFIIGPEAPTFTNLFATAEGTYTTTSGTVATPEPRSLAFMLSGVGLVFAMRKHWALGLQQAG